MKRVWENEQSKVGQSERTSSCKLELKVEFSPSEGSGPMGWRNMAAASELKTSNTGTEPQSCLSMDGSLKMRGRARATGGSLETC